MAHHDTLYYWPQVFYGNFLREGMFIGVVWRHKHQLVMVLQAGVWVHKYLYVDPNTIAQKVSMHHVGMMLD
jgi:hypothetical protein